MASSAGALTANLMLQASSSVLAVFGLFFAIGQALHAARMTRFDMIRSANGVSRKRSCSELETPNVEQHAHAIQIFLFRVLH